MRSEDIELDDNEQALVKKTIQVFAELCDVMPKIGFLSRKKRVYAYVTVVEKAQQYADNGEFSEGEILFVLSMMLRKKKDFQKAAMMAALCLAKFESGLVGPIGFKYANDLRVNMRMAPVDDLTDFEA